MLDAFFGQKTPPSDILAFGILALEVSLYLVSFNFGCMLIVDHLDC